MPQPRYYSTRSPGGPHVPFLEALAAGLAPDGGLYLPDSVPGLPPDWRSVGAFDELAVQVLERWLSDEIPAADLAERVRDALSFDVPLVPLSGAWRGVSVLELFHGPTSSFKDFGARTMARLMPLAVDRATILVATSGDTGSAVADGFSGVPGIRVVLLYPAGQVSPIQERQLIVRRPGVTALRVQGTFDDCQRMVKDAFADPALASVRLSSANSINIGRLLPQMLYYVWALRTAARPATVCVPSGNLGNLCGALLAHRSGLPVAGFIAAHNANRFFPDYLAGGADRGGASIRTLSNAMDVGVPSNFERIRVLLGRREMQHLIRGESVGDDETVASMRRVHEETGYVADPHTAVGLEAVRRARGSTRDGDCVVVATAHPAKFPETVARALGIEPSMPAGLAALAGRETDVQDVEATAEALRGVVLQGATG